MTTIDNLNSTLSSHISNTSNPHNITPDIIEAAPKIHNHNAETILVSDEVAASMGLEAGANVNNALQTLSTMAATDGLTLLTITTEDGDPISGVTVSGLLSPAGGPVTSDINGQCLVVCTADTLAEFEAPYWDIPIFSTTVSPLTSALNEVSITMPFLAMGEVYLWKKSASKYFWKNNKIDICLVGGGGGGGGLYFYQTYNNASGSHSGTAYGGGGGAIITYTSLTTQLNTKYEMIVGAGGAGGAASSTGAGKAGGSTSFMGYSAAGGNGATSAYRSNSNSTSSASVKGKEATAVGNGGTASGAAATVYPFNNNSYPAGGGGGCGYYT